jgi:hypothetical protein
MHRRSSYRNLPAHQARQQQVAGGTELLVLLVQEEKLADDRFGANVCWRFCVSWRIIVSALEWDYPFGNGLLGLPGGPSFFPEKVLSPNLPVEAG